MRNTTTTSASDKSLTEQWLASGVARYSHGCWGPGALCSGGILVTVADSCLRLWVTGDCPSTKGVSSGDA